MKIYISGKISGLEYSEVEQRFSDAETLLKEIGFEVANPLKNGLDESSSWNEHLCADIEMLLPCDAIYMMDNWRDSVGASIEYDIANRMGKDVWFESQIARRNKQVLRIQNAIHEVTGMRFSDYMTNSRDRSKVFARMMFVYHCRKNRMRLVEIAQYVHRTHATMLYLLRKYDDDFRYNPQFRKNAAKVNEILTRQSV